MAIAAYTDEGLLKKNPLLGTSLLSGPGRKEEKRKFGALHQRAVGHRGTKEDFQQMIKQETDEANRPALEALAAFEQRLGGEREALSASEARQSQLEDLIAHANQRAQMVASAGTSNMRRFMEQNPQFASEAGAVLGGKGRIEYAKGKGSVYQSKQKEFEDLRKELSNELTKLGDRPGLLEQMAALQSGQSGAGKTPSGPNDAQAFARDLGSFLKQGASGLYEGLLSYSAGPGVEEFKNIGSDPAGTAKGYLARPIAPLLSGDYLDFFDPGNFKGLAKSASDLITGKSKKKKKKAKRKARAAGEVRAYLDDLRTQQARASLEGIRNLQSIAQQKAGISDIQKNITSNRQTLEDRANFYGGFFS